MTLCSSPVGTWIVPCPNPVLSPCSLCGPWEFLFNFQVPSPLLSFSLHGLPCTDPASLSVQSKSWGYTVAEQELGLHCSDWPSLLWLWRELLPGNKLAILFLLVSAAWTFLSSQGPYPEKRPRFPPCPALSHPWREENPAYSLLHPLARLLCWDRAEDPVALLARTPTSTKNKQLTGFLAESWQAEPWGPRPSWDHRFCSFQFGF
jgi:hypothetical protein